MVVERIRSSSLLSPLLKPEPDVVGLVGLTALPCRCDVITYAVVSTSSSGTRCRLHNIVEDMAATEGADKFSHSDDDVNVVATPGDEQGTS